MDEDSSVDNSSSFDNDQDSMRNKLYMMDNNNPGALNNFDDQPYSFYPQGVPDEVLAEIERDKIEKKTKKRKLLLNCVPGLNGKANKQKFVFKVYAILSI
jgi:hypothetical protein